MLRYLPNVTVNSRLSFSVFTLRVYTSNCKGYECISYDLPFMYANRSCTIFIAICAVASRTCMLQLCWLVFLSKFDVIDWICNKYFYFASYRYINFKWSALCLTVKSILMHGFYWLVNGCYIHNVCVNSHAHWHKSFTLKLNVAKMCSFE